MNAQAILLRIQAVVSGQQSVSGLQQSITGLGSSLLGLEAGLSVLQRVTDGIGRLVTQSESWADAANKAATANQVFELTLARFGIRMDEASGAAERLASKFGMSVDEVKDSMTTLIRAGFTDMKQLEEVMTGAAASAVAFGRTASEGFERVGDAAVTGLSAALNSIGISENLGPAFDQYAKSLNTTADALTQQQKAQVLANLVMKATGTEVEALSTIQNEYVRSKQAQELAEKNFAKTMGEITMPYMVRFNALTAKAIQTASDMARAFSEGKDPLEALAATFPQLSAQLQRLRTVATSLSPTFNILSRAFDAVRAAATGAEDPVEALTKRFPQMAGPIRQVASLLSQAGSAFNRFSLALDGGADPLTALTQALPQLASYTARLRPELARLGASFAPAFQAAQSAFQNVLVPIFQRLAPLVGEAVVRAAPILTALVQVVTQAFTLIETLWTNVLAPVWDAFAPAVTQAIGVVSRALSGLLQVVAAAFEAISKMIKGDWKGAWKSFAPVAVNALGNFLNAIGNFLDRTLEGFQKLVPRIIEVFKNAQKGLADAANQAGSSMAKAFMDGFAVVAQSIENTIRSAIVGVVQRLPPEIIEALKGAGIDLTALTGGGTPANTGNYGGGGESFRSDILRHSLEKTGNQLADETAGWCARWVKLTLAQAEPQAAAAIGKWFGGDANTVKDRLRSNKLLRQDWSQLKPGDVVLYDDNHIGIYVGKNAAGEDIVRGNNQWGVKNGRAVVSDEKMTALGSRAGFVSIADIPEIAKQLNLSPAPLKTPQGSVNGQVVGFNSDKAAVIQAVAQRLGVNPNDLAAVISFETSGKFTTNAQNRNSSATGLIQFMQFTDGTNHGKNKGAWDYYGMTRSQFGALSFDKQMEYVERYFKERGIGQPGKTSLGAIYDAVTGTGYRAGSDNYEANRNKQGINPWDTNQNGIIEPGESVKSSYFTPHIKDYFSGAVTPAAAPVTVAPKVQPTPATPKAPVASKALEAVYALNKEFEQRTAGYNKLDRNAADFAAATKRRIDYLKSLEQKGLTALKDKSLDKTARQYWEGFVKRVKEAQTATLAQVPKVIDAAQIAQAQKLLDTVEKAQAAADKNKSPANLQALERAKKSLEAFRKESEQNAFVLDELGKKGDKASGTYIATAADLRKYGNDALKLFKALEAAQATNDPAKIAAAQRAVNAWIGDDKVKQSVYQLEGQAYEGRKAMREKEAQEKEQERQEDEARAKDLAQTKAQIAEALRQGNIELAQQEADRLEQLRETQLRKDGDNAAARLATEKRFADEIYNAQKAIADKTYEDAVGDAARGMKQLSEQELTKALNARNLAYAQAEEQRQSRLAEAAKAQQELAAAQQAALTELTQKTAQERAEIEVQAAKDAQAELDGIADAALKSAGEDLQYRLGVVNTLAEAQIAAATRVAQAELTLAKRQNEARRDSEKTDIADKVKSGLLTAEQGKKAAADIEAQYLERNSALYRAYTAAVTSATDAVEKGQSEAAKAVSDASDTLQADFDKLKDGILKTAEAGQFGADAYFEAAEGIAELRAKATTLGLSDFINQLDASTDAALNLAQATQAAVESTEGQAKSAAAAADGLAQRQGYKAALDDLESLYEDLEALKASGKPVGDSLGIVQAKITELEQGWENFKQSAADDSKLKLQAAGLRLLSDAALAAALNTAKANGNTTRQGQIQAEQARRLSLTRDAQKALAAGQAELAEMLGQKSIPAWEKQAKALEDMAKGNIPKALADQLKALAEGFREAGRAADSANIASKLTDLKAALAMTQLEGQKGLGLVSEEEYLSRREGLEKAAARRRFTQALLAGENMVVARQQLQNDLTAIDLKGQQDRQRQAESLAAKERATAQKLADLTLEQRKAAGMSEVQYVDEKTALLISNRNAEWNALSQGLAVDSPAYLAAYAEFQADITRLVQEGSEERQKAMQNEAEALLSGVKTLSDSIGNLLGAVGLGELGKVATGIGTLYTSIERGKSAIDGIGPAFKKSFGAGLGAIGGVVGIAAEAINVVDNIGTSIMNMIPGVQKWRKGLLEVAEAQKAVASTQVGMFNNPYAKALKEDAGKRDELANAGFLQHAWWFLTGSAPKVMQEGAAKLQIKAAEIFGELGQSVSGALESSLMNAFESGDWGGVEEALDKSLNTFIAKAALKAAMQESRLTELMKAYSDARAAGQDGKAELAAVRAEMSEVANDFKQLSAEFKTAQHWDFKSGISAGMNAVFEGKDPLEALRNGLYERIKSSILEGLMVKRYMSQIQPLLDQMGETLGKGLNPVDLAQKLAAQLPQLSAQMQLELGPIVSGLQSALGQNTAALAGNTAALKEAQFQQTYITQYSSVGPSGNMRRRLGGL